MAPACLPSSLLGVTISQSITHTLLPSDPSHVQRVAGARGRAVLGGLGGRPEQQQRHPRGVCCAA